MSTTLYPFQFIVEEIGGEKISVETVYPPGADAHTYEPTSKEMAEIAKSDAFIYLGAGMEGFAESAADALKNQEVKLIEIGKQDELFHEAEVKHTQEDGEETHENKDVKHNHNGEGHHHGKAGHDNKKDDSHQHKDHSHHVHGDHDPHILLDPLRMIEIAEFIKEELIELNPEDEAAYDKKFNGLKAELTKLDETFIRTLEDKKNKHILVAHAAFEYWEERYGIEQLPISGLSPSSEPSQKELTNVIDQAKQYELDYILFEQNSSSRVSEIIQEQIYAEALTIHNLSVLTEKDTNNNEDYISLMNYNLDVLDKAMD